MENNFSPADIAAVLKNDDGAFGGSGGWWIILLFICLFGGGFGGWGNNGYNSDVAGYARGIESNLQRGMDLNAIQAGQTQIGNDVQRTAYEVGGIVKDAQLSLTTEARDIQSAVATDYAATTNNLNTGFTNMQTAMCGLGKQLSENKYEAALNTAAINANIDAKFAAIEKGQLEARLAAQDDQIDALRLAAATCGIPRLDNHIPVFPAGPGWGGPGWGPGPYYGATAF